MVNVKALSSISIIHFVVVDKSYLTLCHPMDCSMPGFPVFHYLSPGIFSNSCPLSWWCHSTISFSVAHFSSCPPQSFPASGSFPVSQLLTSGDQSVGASASASILLMNIQNWFPLGFTGLISFPFKGLSRVFSSTTIQKHQFFSTQSSSWSNTHICTWRLEKSWLWLYWTFVETVMSLLFNMLSLSYCSFQRASIF